MNTKQPRRLYILWFVAAALALAAVAIELIRLQTWDWTGSILGGACLLMGLISMRRARTPGNIPPPP